MSIADLAIVAALIFGWGTLSARLERFDVTAPITFVLAGLLLTHGPLAVLDIAPSKELIKELAEFTLALVLFSDASRVGLHELRVDAGLYVRLPAVALPLTIGLGTVLALVLTGTNIWLALLVGAALAPTDAALGAGMMGHGRPGGLVRSPGPGVGGVRVARAEWLSRHRVTAAIHPPEGEESPARRRQD
jgi:NhaP-type Na+/H+ or K+/H+ antiporter